MFTTNDQLLLHINKHLSKLDLKVLYLMNLEKFKRIQIPNKTGFICFLNELNFKKSGFFVDFGATFG